MELDILWGYFGLSWACFYDGKTSSFVFLGLSIYFHWILFCASTFFSVWRDEVRFSENRMD